MKSEIIKGYELIGGVLLSFGIAALTVDYISNFFPDISSYESVFWGWWGCIILSAPYYLSKKNMLPRMKQELQSHGKLLLGTALMTSAAGIMWFWSMFQTTSGMVALLGQAEMIFAFILGIIFLKERVNIKEIIGLLVALAGFVILSYTKGEITPFTLFIIMLLNFLYAAQSFCVKKFGKKIDSVPYSYLRVLIMAILMSIYLLSLYSISWVGWFPFFILAGGQIFGFILGRTFYFQAHKYLNISTLNSLLLFEPVPILIGGFLLFGDVITPQKAWGSILIFLGLLYFSWEKQELKTVSSEP